MSKTTKGVFLKLGFAFSIVALLVACPRRLTSAAAGSRVVGGITPPHDCLTHIGQPVANLVALRCNTFSGLVCTEFRREHLDGSEDAFPFSIPSGMVFVITDVSWSASVAAGTGLRFFIQSAAPSDLYEHTAVADSNGFVAFADHFTTGFAFSRMPGFVIVSSASTDATNRFIGVQGYLVSQCAPPGAIFEATNKANSIRNGEPPSPKPTDH